MNPLPSLFKGGYWYLQNWLYRGQIWKICFKNGRKDLSGRWDVLLIKAIRCVTNNGLSINSNSGWHALIGSLQLAWKDTLSYTKEIKTWAAFVNPHVTMSYNGILNRIQVKNNKTFHIKKIKSKKKKSHLNPFKTWAAVLACHWWCLYINALNQKCSSICVIQ